MNTVPHRLLSILLSAIVSPLLLTVPAHGQASDDPEAQRELLLSTLWYQRAPEFQLLARSTFKHAEQQLPAALHSQGSAALEQRGQTDMASLPAAVIVDLDETMLDNSAYQAYLVSEHRPFDYEQSWGKWLALRQAKAVPGAVAFSNRVVQSGATIFYVSNRSCGSDPDCKNLDHTMANMAQLGFARATDKSAFLLKKMKADWSDEKSGRRAEIAKTYRIVMLLGDNLHDFLPADQAQKMLAGDPALQEFSSDMLGLRWFVLPNPMYGSWLDSLTKTAEPVPVLQKLYSALAPVNFIDVKKPLTLATWNLEWLMTPQSYQQMKPHCVPYQPKSDQRSFPCDSAKGSVPARTQDDYNALVDVAGHIKADVVALQEVDGQDAAKLVFREGWRADCFISRQHPQKVGFAIRAGVPYRCNPEFAALDADGASRAGADITLYPQTASEVRLLAVHLKSGCFTGSLASSVKNSPCPALRTQVPLLAGWVDARAQEGVAYAILGDFNRRLELDAALPAGPDPAHPIAVFQAISDGKPVGATLKRATEEQDDSKCSKSDSHPPGSIDNILVSTQLLGAGKLTTSRVMYDEKIAAARKLSDHCPMVVKVR